MLGGIFKKSSLPLGLDVGAHGLRLVQLEANGHQLAVTAAAREPLPAGLSVGHAGYHDAITTALTVAFKRGGFTQRQVIGVLPTTAVLCKNLRLPRMPVDELASAVQFEASDRSKPGEAAPSVQFLNAGEVRQGDGLRQEIILLSASMSFVEAHVKSMIDAGLKPQAIDAVPTTVTRCFDPISPNSDGGPHVAIDLGWSSTKITISRAGRVLFYKPIDLGLSRLSSACGDAWPETLEREPEASEITAMAGPLGDLGRELGLCLRYYGVTFRGARPESATVVGGGALSPWLVQALSEQSGLTLEVGRLPRALSWDAVRSVVPAHEEAAWSVALGLALRNERTAQRTDATQNNELPERGVAA